MRTRHGGRSGCAGRSGNSWAVTEGGEARFLRYWEKTEQPRRLRARIVSYADDLLAARYRTALLERIVILSCGRAAEALDWTRRTIPRTRP